MDSLTSHSDGGGDGPSHESNQPQRQYKGKLSGDDQPNVTYFELGIDGDDDTHAETDADAVATSSGAESTPRTTAMTLDGDIDEEQQHNVLLAGGRSQRGNGIAANSSADGYDGQDDFDGAAGIDDGFRAGNQKGTQSTLWDVIAINPLRTVFVKLYGDALSTQEMVQTLCLAVTLLMIVGAYWMLRSVKDTVIVTLCGYEYIPKAQMLSPLMVFLIVTIYNCLLDMPGLKKHQLFYIFGIAYSVLFAVIAALLMDPVIGLPNEKSDPTRILGWIHYFAIDSFGSIMTALFWSFTNSTVSAERAKASYGIMVATAQIGSIIGATVVQQFAQVLGVAQCYMLGAITILLTPLSMFLYIRTYGSHEQETSDAQTVATTANDDDDESPAQNKRTIRKQQSNASKSQQPKSCESCGLFIKHSYVRGILFIGSFFIIQLAIVDYTMKVLAVKHFSSQFPCKEGDTCWDPHGDHKASKRAMEAMTSFMGTFGQVTNTLTFVMSLLGTSAIIRSLGLRLTLLLFPSMCLIVVVIVLCFPSLYLLFGAMIILKASSYALNNPTKEILYQPTSSAVRYKAKSWIDMFGARGSKAIGGLVTDVLKGSTEGLVLYGSLVGMSVSTFLIYNAYSMGLMYEKFEASGFVVGEEEEEDGSAVVVDDEDHESQSIQMAPLMTSSANTANHVTVEDDVQVAQ